MEIPNKTIHEEIMDFRKFAERKGLIYYDEKVWIEGKFKEEGSKKIFDGDNFWANKVLVSGKPINAETIYGAYLEWFNYTLRAGESKRIVASAKVGDALHENDAVGQENEHGN